MVGSIRGAGRQRPRTLVVAFLLILATAASPAMAQSVRSLGMGGVSTPAASGRNPAFIALPDDTGTSIPLPLGALNLLLQPELEPGGEQFDLITAFDQATHLHTLVFNPATSPDEIIVTVANENGVPTVELELVGGSPLQITSGSSVGYGQKVELPISFGVGPVTLGIRPYLTASGQIVPDEDFAQLFTGGTSGAGASGDISAEGGIGLSLAYATALELPGDNGFPGQLYLGVRAEPFFGLARVDGRGEFTVSASEDAAGELQYETGYDADLFYAVIGQGGFGLGLRADFGVAAQLPSPEGTVTIGLGLTDVGVSTWKGQVVSFASDGNGSDQSEPAPAQRAYAFEALGVTANAAFEPDPSDLPGMESLLLAADASLEQGSLGTHLGAEAGFDAAGALLLARAGLGLDDGFVFGIGTGVRVAGFGLDAALHSYRSPLTAHRAIGASAGLNFGF